MTGYRLPEGMTAERLRFMADVGDPGDWSDDLNAWADAIDPPKPPSVITDEMVVAVAAAADMGNFYAPGVRKVLEAAERLGWLRDPDVANVPPSNSKVLSDNSLRALYTKDERRQIRDLTERLEIAERLLRRVLTNFPDSVGWSGRVEAEYLRSLDGEDDSDE